MQRVCTCHKAHKERVLLSDGGGMNIPAVMGVQYLMVSKTSMRQMIVHICRINLREAYNWTSESAMTRG